MELFDYMKWFKFYGQDYLSDPKMLSLSASERSCWITLLSYASVNDNGMITHLSEEQLMIQAGIDPMSEEWGKTKNVLQKMKTLSMITHDNEMITIINWEKRQQKPLTPYERVKRHREKKRNDNGMITHDNEHDNDRLDKIRIEENTNTKKVLSTIPKKGEMTHNLKRKNSLSTESKKETQPSVATPSTQTINFFFSVQKGIVPETTAAHLMRLYPAETKENILAEIRRFTAYWTERESSGKRQRWQLQKTFEVPRRLSTWFQNQSKWTTK